jgi:hypothetical protein
MSDEPTMTDETLAAAVAAIPPGRWMSYGDVVAAGGGRPRQTIGVNARLTRLGCDGAHRVLKATAPSPAPPSGIPSASGGCWRPRASPSPAATPTPRPACRVRRRRPVARP